MDGLDGGRWSVSARHRFVDLAVGHGDHTIARTAAAIEIPLGILTALVGTPFFIWLLASVSKTWS